ncbi:MAG TPA: response regulator [Nitrososphaera sp.]|jgi:two-component system response regulator ChvI
MATQEQVTKKGLVMVVDDEEDIGSVFSSILCKEGYNVHAFSNPEIAFEHFRYSPKEYSIIISDVRMPRMSGFQLARKVKELNPKVKVILTSAFEINVSEFEKVMPNTPVDGFLDKPVSFKKLSGLVKKHLIPA